MPLIPVGIVAAGSIANQNVASRIAYQYCTGPVDVFATNQSTTGYINQGQLTTIPANIYYLGTCEQYPTVLHGENWNPLYADETGNQEPFDWELQGEWKIIAMDLNKFVQANLNNINSPGPEMMPKIGKLLQGNGLYFSLILRFTNFGAPIAPADMPPGEYYPCCRVIGLSYPRLGSKDRVMNLTVRTCPLLNLVKTTTATLSLSDPNVDLSDPNLFTGQQTTPAGRTQLIYATPSWIASLPKVA